MFVYRSFLDLCHTDGGVMNCAAPYIFMTYLIFIAFPVPLSSDRSFYASMSICSFYDTAVIYLQFVVHFALF